MEENILFFDGVQFGVDGNRVNFQEVADHYFIINGFEHFTLKQLLMIIHVLNSSNVRKLLIETVT